MSRRKMTQFIIDKTCGNSSGKAKLGHLTVDLRNVATPGFLVHTLGGSVPHLTADTIKYSFPSEHELHSPPLVISVDSTYSLKDVLGTENSGGIAKFVGLPYSPVFLNLHNSLVPLRGGYNDKNGVAIWTRTGRTSIDSNGYQQIVKAFKPSIFQGISDYDVTESSGSKRVRKSTSRAIEQLEEISKTKVSGNSPGYFVTIESAWVSADEAIAKNTVASLIEKQDQIQGFVIQGISHTPTKEVPVDKKYLKQSVVVNDVCLDLVEKVVSLLPSEKPKYVPGPFKLPQIIELVRCGIDLFDSSLVTRMADDGEAFNFDCLVENGFLRSNNVLNESLPKRNDEAQVMSEVKSTNNNVILLLKENRFFSDFDPISKYCMCYTCRNHTRSYLNHLYKTDELLGPVLLMIHNLTLFSEFFQTVRKAVADDSISEPISKSCIDSSRLIKLQTLVQDK